MLSIPAKKTVARRTIWHVFDASFVFGARSQHDRTFRDRGIPAQG
jgi:hypothetical protein